MYLPESPASLNQDLFDNKVVEITGHVSKHQVLDNPWIGPTACMPSGVSDKVVSEVFSQKKVCQRRQPFLVWKLKIVLEVPEVSLRYLHASLTPGPPLW